MIKFQIIRIKKISSIKYVNNMNGLDDGEYELISKA